ncbi:hypothetical protein [Salinarimonas chemoclinalis]
MAKSQMRGNKEARKPKTKKEAAPPPTGFAKGSLGAASTTPPKKKG